MSQSVSPIPDTREMVASLEGGPVVIVDDHEAVREMVGYFLRQAGIPPTSMIEFSDGVGLEEMARQGRPMGFVLLDWVMPGMSGLKALSRLRAYPAYRKTPVLMITGRGEGSEIVRAVEEGADGYVVKPFTAVNLIEKMKNILLPPRHARLLDEAETLLDRGELAPADERIQAALAEKPESAGARLLRARLHEARGELRQAETMLREAVARNPAYLRAYGELARFYRRRGSNDLALEILLKADRLSPHFVSRKLEIGGLSLDLGQAEQADRIFREALALDHEAVDEVVEICAERDASTLAREYLDLVVARKRAGAGFNRSETDSFVERYNRAGIEFRRKGHWSEAIATYERALGVDPENAVLHFNIGVAYLQVHENAKARTFLERALALNAASPEPDRRLPELVGRELSRLI
ncbi:MAG: response regulator [Nitrospinae bacterium]|nr:response regulator [Nitrospinota bacterium]